MSCTIVDQPRLRKVTQLIFEKACLPAADAELMADHLIWADLRELLAGELFSTDIDWPGEADRAQRVSLLLIAIDPTVSIPYQTSVSRVDDLIDRINGSRAAPETERVTVPGKRTAETMTRRRAKGIPVPDELLETLRKLAAGLGISW